MITRPVGPDLIAGNITSTHDTEAATVAVEIVRAAVAAQRHVLHGVQWSYAGGTVTGKLTIKNGATTVYETDITATGPGGHTLYIETDIGAVLTVTLGGGGTGVTGKLNIQTTTR